VHELKVQVQKYTIDSLDCTKHKSNKKIKKISNAKKKTKTTKYLKTKDYENRSQLQKELKAMISQEFSHSKHREVFHLSTIMIIIGINAVPLKGTV
jgi:hypothetical protein